MFEEAGLGRLVVRELGLGDRRRRAGPRLAGGRSSSGSRPPSRASRSPSSASTSSCPTPTCRVTEALRHAAWAHGVDAKVRWVDSEALTQENLHDRLDGRGRHPRPGRVRPSRHRGQGPRRPLRPRPQGAVPRPVPRPAVRGDRVRPRGHRIEGRQLDRVRHVHRAPGDRLHARPARARGQGRHDAARALPGAPDARLEGRRGLRRRGHLRAPPPPLRGQQPLPPDARGRRACSCPASRPTAASSRSSSSRTTRGSSPRQFHPEFKSRPERPHPLFDGLRRRGARGPRRPRAGVAATPSRQPATRAT